MIKEKKILIFFVLIIAAVLVFYFYKKSAQVNNPPPTRSESPKQTDISKDPPKIVSTNPNPLDQAVITTDQQIEIVFNRGLENEGELKIRMEPKVKYKITLSGDRKTAKIIQEEPYELGVGYTMFITGDTKFEGLGPWGEEKTFHFQTIKYRGI